MNENYEKMKQSIISNLNAIKHLLEIANSLQESLSQVTDEEVKKKLSEQVQAIFDSVSSLTVQTNELFDAYKGLFRS